MDEISKLLSGLEKLFNDKEVGKKLGLLRNVYEEIDENQNNQELCKEVRDQWKRDLFDLKWITNCLVGEYLHPIELINKLYEAGDRLYCLSVYDILSNAIKTLYDADKDNTKDIYERIIWLGECLYKHDFVPSDNLKQGKQYYPKINKEYLHKLDGMDVLLTSLGEDKFIQLALAGSYFFDTKLVENATKELAGKFQDSIKVGNTINNEQEFITKTINKDELIKKIWEEKVKDSPKDNNKKVNKLINLLSNEEYKENKEKLNKIKKEFSKKMCYLKARYTIDENIIGQKNKLRKGDKAVYKFDDNYYRVDIDVDGNRAVRELITKKTGITVAQGKGSILQNTIISHIWGRAYDPRYFTSLWNIVLIPAWANSLMDKEDAPEGTLASKMRATYMKICSELYKEVTFPSNPVNEEPYGNYLTGLPAIKNDGDIISGDYTFNIIKAKKKVTDQDTNENPTQYDVIVIDRDSRDIKIAEQL